MHSRLTQASRLSVMPFGGRVGRSVWPASFWSVGVHVRACLLYGVLRGLGSPLRASRLLFVIIERRKGACIVSWLLSFATKKKGSRGAV